VVAQLDMASTEEAREQYRPESQIVRSEQLSEEQSGSAANGARGVPGSLSNQPPEAGVAQPPSAGANLTGGAANGAGATAAAGGGISNSARQSTRNFEIDRTVAYTRQPGGQLRRLTVAVLIDNARRTDKDGKSVETPLTAAQIERITALVRDAVGFDQARGDSINIVNASWAGEPLLSAEEATEIPLWERPWLQQLVKVLAGLIIALVVIFLVIKPTLTQLLAPLKLANNAPALPPGTAGTPANAGAVVAPGSVNTAISAGATGASAMGGGNNLAYEQQIAQARNLVAQDPARVAQVVKGWVSADG
jgi:flagellar M-ring protein FliF